MQIVDVRESTLPISRHANAGLPSGGLTTSVVALTTDVLRGGRAVVGYGFASIGRYGQGGLIRERFAPRILDAPPTDLVDEAGENLDPLRAWTAMMAGEKPGGHGERCVAVGTLDMAVWDAAAKIAGLPLYRFLARRLGRAEAAAPAIPVYGGGGYPYPEDDIGCLTDEVRRYLDQGYTHIKIKIGAAALAEDLRRIDAVLGLLPGGGHLAVDAMNGYDRAQSLDAAAALAPYGLWWFEDICDPLDFETLAAVAQAYAPAIAAGEALFSLAEARLLHRHGGLRPDKDILLFDPVHCYGLSHYMGMVTQLEDAGWPRRAFWPHGGHLFSQHVARALGLGGSEVNPFSFQPFGGPADGASIKDGMASLPDAPGVGFEAKADLISLLRNHLGR